MTFKVGDLVRLKSLPDGLIHDLPQEEQRQLLSFVGQTTKIEDIDASGFVWLGFGTTTEHGDDALYAGHSFSVPVECLELVS